MRKAFTLRTPVADWVITALSWLVATALIIAAAVVLSGCTSIDDRVLNHQRETMGQTKIAEWCAMSEPQRRTLLLKRLEFTNASGGYIGGRYVDTTVVLSSELGAERAEYRKITGC
jgi:hypothetical protein